jgi:hypothetical protein
VIPEQTNVIRINLSAELKEQNGERLQRSPSISRETSGQKNCDPLLQEHNAHESMGEKVTGLASELTCSTSVRRK